MVVENKPGAGGRVAAQLVKGTMAKQNVLLLVNPAIMVVSPLVFENVGYDPDTDFQPVSVVSDYEFGVAVSSDASSKTLSELMEQLRSGAIDANLGVPATGSLPHFFALMMAEQAGVDAQVVGYRGSGPLMTDLIGRQLPVAVDTLDALATHAEGGKIRILAASGKQRSPFAPEVPTFKESGLDLVADGWNAFVAPSGMAKSDVETIAQGIQTVMRHAEVQELFHTGKLGAVVSSPEQTADMIKAFREQWAPVVRKSGYQP